MKPVIKACGRKDQKKKRARPKVRKEDPEIAAFVQLERYERPSRGKRPAFEK